MFIFCFLLFVALFLFLQFVKFTQENSSAFMLQILIYICICLNLTIRILRDFILTSCEMASSNGFSALVSILFVLILIAAGQFFKPTLAASRQGNLAAGVLGSLIFCFSLTAISNAKMAQFGVANKSGLLECFIALLIAMVASAAIHRIAITLCLLFSGVIFFFLMGISEKYYGGHHAGVKSTGGGEKRRK